MAAEDLNEDDAPAPEAPHWTEDQLQHQARTIAECIADLNRNISIAQGMGLEVELEVRERNGRPWVGCFRAWKEVRTWSA